jgi:hypothetical protein
MWARLDSRPPGREYLRVTRSAAAGNSTVLAEARRPSVQDCQDSLAGSCCLPIKLRANHEDGHAERADCDADPVGNSRLNLVDDLDMANEKRVSAAIRSTRLTRIIVAHRPETIRLADRVIDLDELGKRQTPAPELAGTARSDYGGALHTAT